MYRLTKIFASLALLLWASAVAQSSGSIEQVHVVTRHGSRYPLTKSATTLAEGTPGRLTAVGERQMYDLGVWLRTRYPTLVTTYNPNRVTLVSSAMDRTVTSANSLTLGLFPASARDPHNASLLPGTPANVPVFTATSDNDVTIRAYDKCDTFLDKLQALYNTKPWDELQAAHQALLIKLGRLSLFDEYVDPNTFLILLENVWNVYDEINVAYVECGVDNTSLTCQDVGNSDVLNVLTDAEWDELRDLANRAERMKYGVSSAGGDIGGNLLRTILDRMTDNTTTAVFNLYSAHYPTILGLFAALGLSLEDDYDVAIPDYAAALLFELHVSDDGTRSVHVLYKPGYNDDELTVLRLGGGCPPVGGCPLTIMAWQYSSFTDVRWCHECDNQVADVCVTALLAQIMNATDHGTGSNSSSLAADDDEKVPPMVTGLLIGILTTSFALLVLGVIVRSRQRQRANRNSAREDKVSSEEPVDASKQLTPPLDAAADGSVSFA